MQGQRGAVGSMSETFEFDCGSTSTNATMDQQIFWNNVRDTAENQIPEYIRSPSDINPAYVSSINHEWQNLSGWNIGEPSSSNTPNEINNNEQKRELEWSSLISAGALSGPRPEERRPEPTNALSLDNSNSGPMNMHGSNSHLMSQNLNLNSSIAEGGSDDSQYLDHPNLHKSSGSVSEHTPHNNTGSGSFLIPSGNNGFLVEDTDDRPGCSPDTRRVSCKRKAVEGNVGQSSDGGSSSYTQHIDASGWHSLPTQDNAGSSLSSAISSEQLNARLGLSMGDEASEMVPDSNVAESSESLHRNFRLRINPSSPQNSIPPTGFSAGSVMRHSGASSSSRSQRFHPADSSLNLRSAPPINNMIPQSQPPVIHVPALPRNRQSYRWSGGSSSRNIHSSNSTICPDRVNLPQEGTSSGSMSRNTSEHPVFVPASDLRNFVPNSTIRGSSSGSANLSIPGNVASSSRAAPNSATNPSSASTWVSRPNPPHHPRRLSEYVRRSLFPPGSEATGGPSNNHSSSRSGPSTSESRVVSSGAQSRSALWLERQGDSDLGIPHSLRSLALASEGSSSRIVSELRNVLGIMRRGGNLRFEDVMILDQSVFSGIADIHDRHRDMRLDVDNMSYEELLALEERIGNVSTGLSEETVLKHLKRKKYATETGSQLDAEEPCCVCQESYGDGDDIGTLNCGHDFHSDCIKQWLMHKNLCPICKTTGLAT
ncbi:hypothetical protein RIF29_12717 [Crotalaria pallida]|uniref:RING-type E3 ubiquitin transferase n=1 Tax=Crotalaria pallida TaxID=3830 RepID=A0AAN9P215_CROPI